MANGWGRTGQDGDGQNGGEPGSRPRGGRGPRMEPEILPPGAEVPRDPRGEWQAAGQTTYGYPAAAPQPAPVPQPKGRRWSFAPATYLLLGINCAVFLLMVISGVPALSPTSVELRDWGANRGADVVYGGEWWRLVTATFVHVGFIHLASNMWCLWNLGLLGEPLLGPFGLMAVYLLSGIGGNLLSTAVNGMPGIVGAGASGAVFGLAGVLILLLKSPRLPFPRAELNSIRRSVIYFAVLNFAIGIGTHVSSVGPRIDNMAHLGGFLCGLAVGVPLSPAIGTGRKRYFQRQWVAFAGMAALLALAGFGIASFYLN